MLSWVGCVDEFDSLYSVPVLLQLDYFAERTLTFSELYRRYLTFRELSRGYLLREPSPSKSRHVRRHPARNTMAERLQEVLAEVVPAIQTLIANAAPLTMPS